MGPQEPLGGLPWKGRLRWSHWAESAKGQQHVALQALAHPKTWTGGGNSIQTGGQGRP